jgi:hypothetical protein
MAQPQIGHGPGLTALDLFFSFAGAARLMVTGVKSCVKTARDGDAAP